MSDTRYISPSDRDYIIRTVIGEAATEPPEGQAAVAHVILNRVNRGYGRTPTEVVLSKGQFEPWSTRRDELMSYSPSSPVYSSVAKVVDDVIGNKVKDPTTGATHFLQEDTVLQRSGVLPDWARGVGTKIGAHTFHYPDEPNRPEAQLRVANILEKYTKGGVSTPSPPLAEGLTLIDRYTKKTQPVAEPANPFDVLTPRPENRGVPEPPSALNFLPDRMRIDLPKVGNALVGEPGRFVGSMVDNTIGGYNAARQGLSEVFKGNILPSGPVMTPSEWKPGGALRAAGGVLQSVGGLTGIIPATEALENTVTALTGSEAAGKTAGIIGNAVGPSALVRGGVNRLLPTPRARVMAEEANLTTEELARLQANPRLTPMDINPALQGKAMGLATGEGGDKAKNLLYSRARDRIESAPAAVQDVYQTLFGTPPIVTEQLRQYKQTARQNAQQGFGEAFKDLQFVSPEPVIKQIDAVLKPGVQAITSPGTQVAWGPLEQRLAKLRNELTDGQSVVTDPMRLHEIQYELGREIRALSKSAVGSERHMAGDLRKVQDTLVKQIDDASGGKYQPARQKFKEDMEIQEAYEKGFEIFDTGKGVAGQVQDSPAAWREWWTGKDTKGKKIGEAASIEEQKAVQLAALSEIERRIQGYRHSASRGIAIDEVPWNREKMELVFGKPEADRLHRLLQDEKAMATTDNRMIHNSKTAEAQANAKSVALRSRDAKITNDLIFPAMAEAGAWYLSGGAVPGVAFATTMAARRVANELGRRSDAARNNILADFISSNPSQGNKLINKSTPSAFGVSVQRNPLRITVNPAPPVTYVPSEIREGKRTPLTQD